MGRDLVEAVPEARALFDAASEFTGTDVLRTCARGPMARLSRTDVLQPALTAVSLSCARWLVTRGVEPAAAAGHSVGEIAALATAGALSPVAAVRAAAARGRAMHEAARENPGVTPRWSRRHWTMSWRPLTAASPRSTPHSRW